MTYCHVTTMKPNSERVSSFDHHIAMVTVMSRQNIEKLDIFFPSIVISITDPLSSPPILKEGSLPLCYLHSVSFRDIDDRIMRDNEGSTFPGAMTPQQADDIVDFVLKHHDKVYDIIVHCEGGISRSRGVAAGLCLLLNFHDDQLYRSGTPNTYCKRLIIESLQRKRLL